MKRNYQYLFAGIIFLLLFAIGVFHSTKGGFNFTDEGLYFAAPYSYRFGGLPFRDIINNATRLYDVVLAPIFWIHPGITLLEYRILGVFLQLTSLAALFFLFSRQAAPVFVSAAVGVTFLFNNFLGIPSPSYNLLASVGSIWAFVLWIGSLASHGKRQIVLAIGAGIALIIAAVSYNSAVVVLVIPVGALCWFRLHKQRSYEHATAVLLITVVALLAFAFFLLYISGLFPYYLDAIINDASSSNLALGGVGAKFSRTVSEFISVFPYTLGLIAVVLVPIIGLYYRNLSRYKTAILIGCTLVLLIGSQLFILHNTAHFIFVAWSVMAIPIIFLWLKDQEGIWKTAGLIGLLWSVVEIVTYGALSTNGLQSSVKGAIILFVLSFIALSRVPRKIVSVLLVIFFISGVRFYISTMYLDHTISKLTTTFTHPKLAGIYTVPEKIEAVEQLLSYLKDRVKPGDYLLAFNDLPMLYPLTQTRPVYPNVWTFEHWWPVSYREKLFDKMLASEKVAKYAVRLVTNPGYGWVTPIAYGVSFDQLNASRCIICQYVESNYVLEKMIFPFEIWRRDKGEKFELLQSLNLLYEDRFETWKKATFLIPSGKPVDQTPLWVETLNGQYSVTVREERGEHIVRFDYKGDPSERRSGLDLGFSSERKGFSFVPQEGEEVALTATVRLSGYRPFYPYYSAILYMQDRVDMVDNKTYITNEENTRTVPPLVHKDNQFWKTNSVAIDKPEWKEYVVTRQLRDRATSLNFGITWVPLQAGGWIEIKNIRFYTNKKDKQPIP